MYNPQRTSFRIMQSARVVNHVGYGIQIFIKEDSFDSVKEDDIDNQIKAGVLPYSPAQWSKLEKPLVPMVRSILSRDPAGRPLAKDILKAVTDLL
jgi:hypothetical protein